MTRFLNVVPHTSHCWCTILNVLSVSCSGAEMTPKCFLTSPFHWRLNYTLSLPKLTCCNRLLNSTSVIFSILDMLIITYELIVNEAHYIKHHQTCGKGRGTWPHFEARPLLLNVIKIPPASTWGRPQFGGGLHMRKYGTHRNWEYS